MNHPSLASNSTVTYRRALIYLDPASSYYDLEQGLALLHAAAERDIQPAIDLLEAMGSRNTAD